MSPKGVIGDTGRKNLSDVGEEETNCNRFKGYRKFFKKLVCRGRQVKRSWRMKVTKGLNVLNFIYF